MPERERASHHQTAYFELPSAVIEVLTLPVIKVLRGVDDQVLAELTRMDPMRRAHLGNECILCHKNEMGRLVAMGEKYASMLQQASHAAECRSQSDRQGFDH